MTVLKNIFARIWAFWGLFSFALSFLLILPICLFADSFSDYKKGQAYFIKVANFWMQIWLRLVGCPFTVNGKQYFKKDENYVVVYNHNSFLDVPLSAPFTPGANKTIAKSAFAKIPLFGWFYSRGSVLVDRENERSRIESYEAMKDVLRKGMHMCLYPEGTRNKTSEPLKNFYDGAFKLAIETNKAIIPCIIRGTKEALPANKPFYFFPKKISLTFLPAVSANGKTSKQLNEEVKALMLTEIRNTKTR
jgi:1-acyl-sn-glycerol-3-phosphate acyltransferase